MSIFFKILFLVSLASMVVVYPMYFLELSGFGKIMRRDHSDLLDGSGNNLAGAYRILHKVKSGQLDGVTLSPEAALAHSRTKRLLYLGATLFLVVLFVGLTDAVLSKQG
jgi:hypothetical protein